MTQRETVSRKSGNAYVHGTAARKIAQMPALPDREGRPERVRRQAQQRNPRRQFRTLQGGLAEHKQVKRSTFLYLMSMVTALVLAALALYRYVDIQTSLESSVTQISSLEKELATLRKENDEAYSMANATVDLEEVKRVAIQELGMKYADEGQIIVYSDDGAADYVRQIAQIPEAGK